jgi:hypothetical protein
VERDTSPVRGSCGKQAREASAEASRDFPAVVRAALRYCAVLSCASISGEATGESAGTPFTLKVGSNTP